MRPAARYDPDMAEEHGAAQGAEQRWVPIAQAARALGITERAIRGRVARGTIPCRREVVGNHARHRVLLTLPRHDPRAEPHGQAAAELAELRVLVERLQAAAAARDARIADLERDRERLMQMIEGSLARLAEQPERRRWRWWRRKG